MQMSKYVLFMRALLQLQLLSEELCLQTPSCRALGRERGAAGKVSSSPAIKHWWLTMFTEGSLLHTY